MSNIKDICEVDRILPIHQLNKINEKGTERQNFFPISVVQAIFDKTGIRLDAIISSFNYLFLPWKGTKEATRLQVVGLMRRKSLVVCYRDLDDNITIEMYNSNERGNDEWKKDDNWKDFADWLLEIIIGILGSLDKYPDIKEQITNIINKISKEIIDNWLEEYANTTIENKVVELFNSYIAGSDFKELITNYIEKTNHTSWFNRDKFVILTAIINLFIFIILNLTNLNIYLNFSICYLISCLLMALFKVKKMSNIFTTIICFYLIEGLSLLLFVDNLNIDIILSKILINILTVVIYHFLVKKN